MVYEWARGMPFKDICNLTDVMEGTIVRAMVRLDETCRWVSDAPLGAGCEECGRAAVGLVQLSPALPPAHLACGAACHPRSVHDGQHTALLLSSAPPACRPAQTCLHKPARTHIPCREFRDAARVMGNTALFQQMEKASSHLKRDVVFAASLCASNFLRWGVCWSDGW